MTNTLFVKAPHSIIIQKIVNKNKKNSSLKVIKKFRFQACFVQSKSIHKNDITAGHRKEFILRINLFRDKWNKKSIKRTIICVNNY